MNAVQNLGEMEISLGDGIKKLRLHKNMDRETLAERAGLSLTAIKNLEGGKGASVKTLLLVLRALGREDWLTSLAPVATINPLHMVRSQPTRKRASARRLTHVDKKN